MLRSRLEPFVLRRTKEDVAKELPLRTEAVMRQARAWITGKFWPTTADEFFAGVRECYNRRTEDPEFNRLTFCLR